jgi:NAD-dependent deacetylase
MATAHGPTISGPTVFFTGAGISVGAGLPTYRGRGGLYEDSDLEPPHARDLAPERLPGLWARFGDRLQAASSLRPAAAHLHIAELEQRHGHPVTVVTQNVDGLHTAAGSSRVIELHGTLATMRCLGSGHRCLVGEAVWVAGVPTCPTCSAPCRPDVVLFGEILPQQAWMDAQEALAQAETVVAVGTSGSVFPAASLIHQGALTARNRIWINPETEPGDPSWTWLRGDADAQVALLVPA